MKRLFTLIAACFIATTALHAQQHDLSISYTNYTEGQYIGYGNIQTEFKITNVGPTDLHVGDTLLLAAKFNNKVYDMYLNKQDSVTLWKLTDDLPVGGNLTLNPGFLIGWQWASNPNFRIPDGTLTLTLMVYGVGLSSWNNNYADDPTPLNNKTTIIYKNVDLSVSFDKYVHKEVINSTKIYPSVKMVNKGPVEIKAGETVYLRASINGALYSLSLIPNDTTKYVLTSDWAIGDTIPLDLSYVDAEQTISFLELATGLQIDTLQVGVLVYGVGKSSVNANFRTDSKPLDNKVTVTYNPSVKDNLSITYDNYTEGEYIGYGNIETAFTIVNNGPTTFHKGDTILLAAKFNNKVYDMYLNKQDSVTLWKLTEDLPVGGSLKLNPGYLIGWQWASNANFRIPEGTLTLTLMVYGKGLASWYDDYASDSDPMDNKTTIIYKNVDLSVRFDNYVNKEVTYSSKILPKFSITNNGPVDIKAGETLYLRASLNGALYSMALVANDTTKYVLTSDFAIGETISIDPGYVDAAQIASFLAKDTLQVGVLVYGVGKSSVNANFRTDSNPLDNKVTVTYNPAVKDDLAIKFTQYAEGQTIGYGNIQTAFTVTNNGPTTLHAGDTILLAAKFNNAVYDLYLNKVDSVTLWKLTQDIPVGGTLTLNPGYLEGHSWQYWLPVNFPEMPTNLFTLTLMVYGKGLASWNSDFSTDANPADNETTITYKNIDLAISFDDYTPNEVTTNSTIQTAFTITNNGPVTLKSGETIYLQAQLNGDYYSLSLAPGDTTAYTLTSDLIIGGSLELNLGVIDAIQTSQLLGSDSLQLGVVLHGLKQSPFITATKFATDGDSTNNVAYVTYKESLATGVTNKKNPSAVKVYPNPAATDINFQFTVSDVQKIMIVDASGRLVKEVAVSNSLETVNVTDMISGIYYYSILSSSGVVASDIMIVR